MDFSNILIVGLGLMGGSIGWDLLKLRQLQKFSFTVTGLVRTEKSKEKAIERTLADAVFTQSEFENKYNYKDYDLIILAIPVASSIEFLHKIPQLPANAVVTEVGSTKRALVKEYLEKHFYEKYSFIACHPMAGSEYMGPAAAVNDLYKKKLCFITSPELDSLASKLVKNFSPDYIQMQNKNKERILEFWELLGSICFPVHADAHDEMLAYLSHSPHLISALLTTWAFSNISVKSLTKESPMPLTGGGFKDMARIAGSNPEMWREIIETNKDNIIKSLLDYKNQLERLIQLVDNGDVMQWDDFIRESYTAKKFLTEKFQSDFLTPDTAQSKNTLTNKQQ